MIEFLFNVGISLCKLCISLKIFLFNSKTIKQDNFVHLDCRRTHFAWYAYNFCVTKFGIFLLLIALNKHNCNNSNSCRSPSFCYVESHWSV